MQTKKIMCNAHVHFIQVKKLKKNCLHFSAFNCILKEINFKVRALFKGYYKLIHTVGCTVNRLGGMMCTHIHKKITK